MSDLQKVLLCVAVLQVGWELFLKYLNLKRFEILRKSPPVNIDKLMDKKEWEETSKYSIAKTNFSVFEDIVSIIFFPIIIIYLYPWFFTQWNTDQEQSSVICAFLSLIFLMTIQLPSTFFDWWRQFKIEENFGFNKSSKKLWITDKIKEFFLSIFLGSLIFWILINLYRYFSQISDFWWVWAFLTFFGIQLALMVLWPKLILPLFNKLSPLEDGSLKDRLEALSKKAGFLAQEIDVLDGSKRSGHSNAFFTGFGKFRRIVIFDTLIKQMEEKEIEAVLAHEIGHYKMGHIPKRLITFFCLGLIGFWLFSQGLNNKILFESLDLPIELVSSFSAITVGFMIFLPYLTYWLSPLSNYWSRKHEFEADRFAMETIGDHCELTNALAKMYKKNLSHPLPHPWVSFFHHSHPSFFEREVAMSEK
ncbi:MAG: hypothetical protein CBC16_07955 [Verrucomicrobia bacterium TMED56]|jgi:STE24 endopeptidase|nr:MAG: hypothetical protein CBC16_07955 [Verrucomicrobia bacterium TMED56]